MRDTAESGKRYYRAVEITRRSSIGRLSLRSHRVSSLRDVPPGAAESAQSQAVESHGRGMT
jgi:hypothetical protein